MKSPSQVYHPSPRKMPKRLPQIEYPAHYEVRRVSNNCGIRWKHRHICVSQVLAGDYVGLEEIDDGVWDVYYGPVWLGKFFEKMMKMTELIYNVMIKISNLDHKLTIDDTSIN